MAVDIRRDPKLLDLLDRVRQQLVCHNSWSGRGLKPKWLTAALAAGKKIEDFAV